MQSPLVACHHLKHPGNFQKRLLPNPDVALHLMDLEKAASYYKSMFE
jgi:hypothetical protein